MIFPKFLDNFVISGLQFACAQSGNQEEMNNNNDGEEELDFNHENQGQQARITEISGF